MDYEAAGRLRDILEDATTSEQLISRTIIPGLDLIGLRYALTFRRTRDASDPDSDFILDIPTGCGNGDCWARVPLAGYHQIRRPIPRWIPS